MAKLKIYFAGCKKVISKRGQKTDHYAVSSFCKLSEKRRVISDSSQNDLIMKWSDFWLLKLLFYPITSILMFFFLLLSCQPQQGFEVNPPASSSNTSIPLEVTRLADLADTLQAVIIYLKDVPKPLTIKIPRSKDSSYTLQDDFGIIEKIKLEPPVKSLLPVLRRETGEPILDKHGQPFILGNGGKSNFTTFTTDDGLALDGINCSMIDKVGNIWFGTAGGGASKYNGKSFINFTTDQGLTDNVVYSIEEDKLGNIWFGTSNGLSKYDGKSFTNFTTKNGLVDNVIYCVLEDRFGNVWLGSEGGSILKYDGKSFIDFTMEQGLASNYINIILEDTIGNLWFGTSDGILKYDRKSFKSITTEQGLIDNTIQNILEDKFGNLWFGTSNGVSKYDGVSFTNYTTENGLIGNDVSSLLEDKFGNLWFGTSDGISKYDGKSFTSFTMEQGIVDNYIISILEDKSGSLWFGTDGSGISRYNGNALTSFTTMHGLPYSIVWSVLEDRFGNIWLGTYSGGVTKFDGTSFTTFTINQGLAGNNIYSIYEDEEGNIWLGTNYGLSKYDGISFTNFTIEQGLGNNDVLSIHKDKQGNIWLGTYGGGVSRFDGTSFMNFTTQQGLTDDIVNIICEDKAENLWFGTNNGVSRFDGTSFMNFTTEQGLADNIVYSIFEDEDENLWIGTDSGLNLLTRDLKEKLTEHKEASTNEPSISSSFFKLFTVQEGLAHNDVLQIAQLKNNKLIIGTNLGITLFNFVEETAILDSIEIFNSFTGFPIKDLNEGQNAILVDSKGIIWAGTGSKETALVRFDYKALTKNNLAPTPIIQRIKVNEEDMSWHSLNTPVNNTDALRTPAMITEEVTVFGKELSLVERNKLQQRFRNISFDSISRFNPLPMNLVLPYHHNSITFDYIALEMSRNFMVRYQYILEGYSKEWSPVTANTSAVFGNMQEGTYTFRLKAKSPEGIWSEPITYTFNISPPWYRTWWAYLLYVVVFLMGLQFFITWRERKLRAENEQLEKVVEIRTAEVVAEKEESDRQRKRSDELLLNILPAEVAEELKTKGSADAKHFDQVTVMFTDFKGFTQLSEMLTPAELVAEIDHCFKAFDHIITKYNVEKIKTIGDAYMCVGGLPTANTTNAKDVIRAALEIQQFMRQHLAKKRAAGDHVFEMRIGIHTGPVVAGIVGIKKFAYDIWGNTVNVAARMESSGETGKINISESTYSLVKDTFDCQYRGKILAKNKGKIDMYFVKTV